MRISARAVKAFLAGSVLAVVPATTLAQHYTQENLVSDISQPDNADGTKVTIDPNLKKSLGPRARRRQSLVGEQRQHRNFHFVHRRSRHFAAGRDRSQRRGRKRSIEPHGNDFQRHERF